MGGLNDLPHGSINEKNIFIVLYGFILWDLSFANVFHVHSMSIGHYIISM